MNFLLLSPPMHIFISELVLWRSLCVWLSALWVDVKHRHTPADQPPSSTHYTHHPSPSMIVYPFFFFSIQPIVYNAVAGDYRARLPTPPSQLISEAYGNISARHINKQRGGDGSLSNGEISSNTELTSGALPRSQREILKRT